MVIRMVSYSQNVAEEFEDQSIGMCNFFGSASKEEKVIPISFRISVNLLID